jgi:hypothetical protein
MEFYNYNNARITKLVNPLGLEIVINRRIQIPSEASHVADRRGYPEAGKDCRSPHQLLPERAWPQEIISLLKEESRSSQEPSNLYLSVKKLLINLLFLWHLYCY